MATNIRFKINGGSYVDPDDVFEPRGSTTARTDLPTFEVVAGQTIADRYHASEGGDTPSGSTPWFFKVGGTFVSVLSLFRRKGYPVAPIISEISVTPSVYVGGAISFSVTLSEGDEVSLEWFHGSHLIGMSSSFSMTAATDSGGTYTVYATNSRGEDYASAYCNVFIEPTASISGSSSVALSGGAGSWTWEGVADVGIYQYRVYVPGHGGGWIAGGGAGSVGGTTSWSAPFGSPAISSTGSYDIVIEVEDMNHHVASASHSFTVT